MSKMVKVDVTLTSSVGANKDFKDVTLGIL